MTATRHYLCRGYQVCCRNTAGWTAQVGTETHESKPSSIVTLIPIALRRQPTSPQQSPLPPPLYRGAISNIISTNSTLYRCCSRLTHLVPHLASFFEAALARPPIDRINPSINHLLPHTTWLQEALLAPELTMLDSPSSSSCFSVCPESPLTVNTSANMKCRRVCSWKGNACHHFQV